MDMVNQKNILLVEDNQLIAELETRLLREHDFQVITVFTGEAAIAITNQRSDIDLILMDIDLGSGINGIDCAEQILSHHAIPLVFLSCHSQYELRELARRVPCHGVQAKPIDKFKFINFIQRVMNSVHSRQNYSAGMFDVLIEN